MRPSILEVPTYFWNLTLILAQLQTTDRKRSLHPGVAQAGRIIQWQRRKCQEERARGQRQCRWGHRPMTRMDRVGWRELHRTCYLITVGLSAVRSKQNM